MLKEDVVESDTAEWATLTWLYRKYGLLRLLVHYRKLNAINVKHAYPFGRMKVCFNPLGGARNFSRVDENSSIYFLEID